MSTQRSLSAKRPLLKSIDTSNSLRNCRKQLYPTRSCVSANPSQSLCRCKNLEGQRRKRFSVGRVFPGRAKLPLSREVGSRIDLTARREPRPPNGKQVAKIVCFLSKKSFTALSFWVFVQVVIRRQFPKLQAQGHERRFFVNQPQWSLFFGGRPVVVTRTTRTALRRRLLRFVRPLD